MRNSQNFWDKNAGRYDRIHGIPKMAHAELVMVHPEKFCRYAEKFLTMQAEER